jgi:hypothetical protein
MRSYVLVAATGLSLLWTGLVRAEPIKDPAELMPAKVVIYAELRQPGAVAKEVADLFAGSVVSHAPGSFAKLREKSGSTGYGPDSEGLGILALLVSPEMVREAHRLGGAAIALTGVKQGEPEFVAVVLPGESNAPGFMIRAALTMERQYQVAGEVEGVSIYQMVRYRYNPRPPPGQPARPRQEETGPAFALLPEAVLIGTPDSVKAAIRRARGKADGETLASAAAFQEARKELGERPGLFTYTDMAAVQGAVEHLPPSVTKALNAFVQAINPKAIHSVAANCTLENGTLSSRKVTRLNPEEKSPLLDVLPTAAFKKEVLHFAPRGALLAGGLSNADGEKRWSRLLELADSIAKSAGPDNGALPSQHVEQVETALGVKIGKDILGKIANVGIAVADPFVDGKVQPGEQPFVVILEATNEEAAKSLTDLVPKVYGLLTNERDLNPVEKEVNGQKISSLQAGRLSTLHYGRHGSTLVLGPNQHTVADSLTNGSKERGMLGDEKVAAALPGAGEPIAVLVSKPLPLLLAYLFVATGASSSKPPLPVLEKSVPRPPPQAKVRPGPQTGEQLQAVQEVRPVRLRGPGEGGPAPELPAEMKAFLKLAETADPFIVTVTRKPDRLVTQARQAGLKPLVAKVTDWLAEQHFQRSQPAPVGRKLAPPPPPRKEPPAGGK